MTVVIKNIPFKIDIDKAQRDLKINNQEDKHFLLQMIKEVELRANPKAIYRELYITEKGADYIVVDNVKLNSSILRRNLEETEQVFIYIITVGREIEEWAKQYTNILEFFWSEEIQKMILNSAVNYLYEKLDGLIASEFTAEMNPGSLKNWPIEEQIKIFSLLGNVEEEIAVKLTDSLLMLPSKTVSGIKFAVESKYENCQFCQREDCPSRQAPYNHTSCR